VLFDAVQRLRAHPIRIMVIGDSDAQGTEYKDYLHGLASGRNDIVFTGWLGKEDVYRHMAISDLAVFPAGQSILWQQAIASGLPLIVGDVGSQDISYLNLADNIVVLPREEIRPECFATAIAQVLETPGRLAAMSEGAIRVADEHLDWDRLVWRTLRFSTEQVGHVEGVAA
jgi:glycosyltransferase involved in cell wall biosynthesis